MLRLLRRLSLRDYLAAPGRLALIVGGIASGIALIAALGIINTSVVANFRTMLERAAGNAALQVTLGTGEIGFDQRVVPKVEGVPGVHDAFPIVRGTLVAADASREVLQLFGVDLVGEAVESYDVHVVGRHGDIIELLSDLDSVFVTEEYARRRGLAVGGTATFATPIGLRGLHIRGLLRPDGIATIFGGNMAVMDLDAAQHLLGKSGRIDQLDVTLDGGVRAEEVARRLKAALPDSLTVARPALRGERFEHIIDAFQAMLDGISLLCLIAGVFIVYNTCVTAVTQRARDLAILIALGIERRAIFTLVILEAAVLGMVASAIGVAGGWGLAHLLLSLVSQSMGVVYQMRFSVESLVISWGNVAWYMTLGTASAVIAALVPAYKAARLDPLELMRPDFREKLTITSPNRLLLGLWGGLIVLTAAAIYYEHTARSIAWGNVAATLWYVSAVILSIPLMSGLCVLLRRALPHWFGFDGRVAVESLTRSPGRTGVTTAVIALSLTIAVAVASIARSFRESERNWFILSGDLVVSSIGTEGGWLETPLSARMARKLRAQPGVEHVETYRVLPGQVYRPAGGTAGEARIAMVGVSPGFADTALFRRQITAGDPDGAVRALATGTGVVVSDNLMDRYGVRPGDTITLPTPTGSPQFRVAAVVAADYSGDQGSVIVGSTVLKTLWRDDLVSHFNVFLTPGTDVEAVRAGIVHRLGSHALLKVLTVSQTLAYHQGMVDRAFVFTYAIQLLVVVVTLAGIFDLLTTQVIERRRELGVFRAIGMDEPHVASAIRLEAAVIGLAGATFGALLAVGTSLLWVLVNFRILIGYVLEHHFAYAMAASCVVLASGVAVLAGHLAARGALKQPVLEALRYE